MTWSLSIVLSKEINNTPARFARSTIGFSAVELTALIKMTSYPALMKLSIAPIWAATSVPVLTIFSSLMKGLISGSSAYAWRHLIISMRQVFPMNPFAKATRYGGFFAGYWSVFVSGAYGLNQSGSEG